MLCSMQPRSTTTVFVSRMVSEPMSGLCRTVAAGKSGRSCKLPARLKEYVLPGQKATTCKVSTRHQTTSSRAASQAEGLCPPTSLSQQHPPAPAKKIIIKLSMKASGVGQGRAPQVPVKQTFPATLQQAGCEQETDVTPSVDSSADAAIASRAPMAKPFRIASVERPVTRRFSLQQQSSSKLKLRIKLKRTTASIDQKPQRMSSLQHQQKRHVHTHHSVAKHDSSTSPPATPSAPVLHDPAFSEAPASAQVLSPMASQLLTTTTVAASGSTTQDTAPAACRQPETAGDYSSRPCPAGTPCSSSIVTAADTQPLPLPAPAVRAEAAALCAAVKPKLPSAVYKAQHNSAAQHVGDATPPCTMQR